MGGELPHRRLEEQHLALEENQLEQLQRPLPIVDHEVPSREADVQLLGVQHVVAKTGVQVLVSLLTHNFEFIAKLIVGLP